VPDSSAVHPSSALLDGQRRLTACGAPHLDELIRHYGGRPYDEDELLAHVVTRAQRRLGPEATLDDVAFAIGLSAAQVMRAMRWNSVWLRWLQDSDASNV
jgi:hypothetical protein